jgi:aspartate carbamoyltransferase catalytic subunit
MVCGPATLIPKHITELGVKVSHNLLESLNWCDAANMLRIQLERQTVSFFPSLREYSMQYGLTKEILNSLNKEIYPIQINQNFKK